MDHCWYPPRYFVFNNSNTAGGFHPRSLQLDGRAAACAGGCLIVLVVEFVCNKILSVLLSGSLYVAWRPCPSTTNYDIVVVVVVGPPIRAIIISCIIARNKSSYLWWSAGAAVAAVLSL